MGMSMKCIEKYKKRRSYFHQISALSKLVYYGFHETQQKSKVGSNSTQLILYIEIHSSVSWKFTLERHFLVLLVLDLIPDVWQAFRHLPPPQCLPNFHC